MARSSQPHFAFPELTESEIRKDRLRSFLTASGVACIPFILDLLWRSADGLTVADVIKQIPDLALGAVVISVSAFTNTIFSFVKLTGWKSSGQKTFALAFFAWGFSLCSFVLYLRATHAPPTDGSLLFFTTLCFSLATFLTSWALQNSFVSDECRWAREYRLKLRR